MGNARAERRSLKRCPWWSRTGKLRAKPVVLTALAHATPLSGTATGAQCKKAGWRSPTGFSHLGLLVGAAGFEPTTSTV